MTTLQIRNVPDRVSKTLKARAAKKGQSLSEYALAELAQIAERSTIEGLTERIRRRGGPREDLVPSAPEILRTERDAR